MLYLWKHLCTLSCVLTIGFILPICHAEWSHVSPDGKNRITIKLSEAGGMRFTVRRRRAVVVGESPLGLIRDDANFANDLRFVSASRLETRAEHYELFSGNRTQVDAKLTHRSLIFETKSGARLILDLAASNEGLAFRYRFPEESYEMRSIESEAAAFSIPLSSIGWLQPYQAAGQYTPAYEDYYFLTKPGAVPHSTRAKATGWAFPALFNLQEAKAWLLLTESGSEGQYPACHLTNAAGNSIYRIAFPAAEEKTRGIAANGTANPRSHLPWTMPWRVIVMGDSAADIAMSTLVTDLAPPSRIPDTSWIHPGRAGWSWWSYPEGPNTAQRYAEFTDLAVSFGWEYTLFDGGWWDVGLKPISEYARSKDVKALAWSFAGDFYDPIKRARKLDELSREGATGVKVDFWCSDRQEALAAMNGLFEDAAKRRMLVSLHGCTLPRGWHRTWPNFITAEAVLGAEEYLYEPTFPERAAELDCILPFTRNVAGPMDYTPVAIKLRKFPRQTTAAHEFATALIFNSGIICYAEGPQFFNNLPSEVAQILRDAPARWDETRCLIADPGRSVVFARRTGKSWFVAGLNGTKSPVTLTLNIRDFSRSKSGLLVSEGANPLINLQTEHLALSSKWMHTMPPQGGFILRPEP